jgi:tetratricopeptide (TPR) repeat protein
MMGFDGILWHPFGVGAKSDPIQSAFFRGDHRTVLSRTVDAARPRVARRQLQYVIGSLAFLGRVEEAQALYESQAPAESCAARFFLGVGLCRLSRYAESRRYFLENLRLHRRSKRPVERFYAYQGLGFYRFFCGRFGAALASARKAKLAALRGGFLWGKLVSSDLMGHALAQTGHVAEGMATLEQALDYARHLGDGGTRQAIRVARACFDAQFGLKADAVAELERLGEELRDEDTYSRAALLLETARQYGLRGELGRAREALHRSSRHIYGSRNRRQSVALSIRYAQLHFLHGEPEQALNLLLSAERDLTRGVDNALEVEFLGIKLKIGLATGILSPDAVAALEGRIRFLTLYTGKGIARRVLERAAGGAPVRSPGEDPLGDLVDRIRRGDEEALREAARSGYLGLLPEPAGVRRSERALCLDWVEDTLLVFDQGSVWRVPERVPATLRKVLGALARGREVSKERLIREVWGYEYRPLQHDPLIYSTISRVRQLLGPYDYWIEATENGYALRAGVRFRIDGAAPPLGDAPPQALAEVEPGENGLNSRQIRLLRHLEKAEFIGARECALLFGVSEITACRDLSALWKAGRLERVGRARATRYRARVLPKRLVHATPTNHDGIE